VRLATAGVLSLLAKGMVQWISPELSYLMIVLNIDNGSKALTHHLVMIERNGEKVASSELDQDCLGMKHLPLVSL
jgi:hypothetical protein